MRRNLGFSVFVEKRISELKSNTQELRSKWIETLDDLFKFAISVAKEGAQQIDGRIEPVTVRERQMWAHVAAHIGLVMGNLAKGYDERQFNEDLAELGRLVNEIKKIEAERAEGRDRATNQSN